MQKDNRKPDNKKYTVYIYNAAIFFPAIILLKEMVCTSLVTFHVPVHALYFDHCLSAVKVCMALGEPRSEKIAEHHSDIINLP